MDRAAKGRRNEHRSRRILELAGFEVIRAAASKGPVDLAGFSTAGVVLIQVKSGRLPSPAEREVLSLFPCPAGSRKLIHVWMPRKREPRVVEL
jgi:Holliday junction resolvase